MSKPAPTLGRLAEEYRRGLVDGRRLERQAIAAELATIAQLQIEHVRRLVYAQIASRLRGAP